MSIGYSTERNLTHRVRRWSELVSYTAPNITYTPTPSANFTSTGTLQWKKTQNSGWNSNIFGSLALATGTMECRGVTGGWMCGVSTQNTTTGYTGITWGISVQAGGTLEVYNAGSSNGAITGGWNTSTIIKMVWTASDIKYYTNNVLQRTYARSAGGLYLNFSFDLVNSEGQIITFSP